MKINLNNLQKVSGFSLVEVLITLALLGILAAFTVPKLLNAPNASQSSKYTRMANDVAFMVLNAYGQYKMTHATVPSSMSAANLTPYMSYISVDTTSTGVHNHPGWGLISCGWGFNCLKLHNGGILWYGDADTNFGGTSSLHSIYLNFDPAPTENASFNAVGFQLYYDGKIKTNNTLTTGTLLFGSPWGRTADPPWFTGFD